MFSEGFCSPGCPGACFVDQAGLECTETHLPLPLPPGCITSFSTFMSDLGIKGRAPSLYSKCLYPTAILFTPVLSFQAWLYIRCWCKYLSVRYLKQGLWVLHRQKEGTFDSLSFIHNYWLSFIHSYWSKLQEEMVVLYPNLIFFLAFSFLNMQTFFKLFFFNISYLSASIFNFV